MELKRVRRGNCDVHQLGASPCEWSCEWSCEHVFEKVAAYRSEVLTLNLSPNSKGSRAAERPSSEGWTTSQPSKVRANAVRRRPRRSRSTGEDKLSRCSQLIKSSLECFRLNPLTLFFLQIHAPFLPFFFIPAIR